MVNTVSKTTDKRCMNASLIKLQAIFNINLLISSHVHFTMIQINNELQYADYEHCAKHKVKVSITWVTCFKCKYNIS